MIIEIRDLTISRGGQTILKGIDFSLREGEKVAITGPNGSGKTTLVREIVRQLPGRVGYLPQQPATVDTSVEDYVLLGRTPVLSPWRGPTSNDRAVVTAALAATQLTPFARRRVGTLSGGERQLAALALALATDAPVLVLDEPTAHLDTVKRDLLFSLISQTNRAVCAVLHDLPAAPDIFSRVFRLAPPSQA